MKSNTAELANAIRALSMDAVQAANSGHPGMPMGMAEIAVALWTRHLRHNPANPNWADRDRFVLSNGHGSMLLYSLLHLTGYDLPIDELQAFPPTAFEDAGPSGSRRDRRAWKPPPGRSARASPMRSAWRWRSACSRPSSTGPAHAIVDHHTYVFLGDGCLMEGISHEACSLAGTLKLGKLIALYDDNGISIDGHVEGWFTDDTPKRFEAYGWHVIPEVDGHDVDAVDRAIAAAKAVTDRPSLICCKTVIGKGSPNKAGIARRARRGAGRKGSRGHARGDRLELPAVRDSAERLRGLGRARARRRVRGRLEPALRRLRETASGTRARVPAPHGGRTARQLEGAVRALLAKIEAKAETIATRKASQKAIEGLAPALPELVGGSADLTGSNLTNWSGAKPVGASGGGNYISYGVREFGMAAIANGMALHGGLMPFGGTFLTFSDYARNALRMAALMKLRNIFVFTHDSIGLGEDGPTHQSVEHVASLRLIPHLDVWRPCDTVESAVAWISAVERGVTSPSGPAALVFSRQNLQFQKRDARALAGIARGGYVLADCAGAPQALILATGSEVQLAMGAQAKLAEAGMRVRVVSMPSTSVFDRQDAAYRETVLPRGVPRVAVEAGVSDYWRKYVGLEGAVIGIDRYGESAPGPELFKYFGFTVDNVVAAVKSVI